MDEVATLVHPVAQAKDVGVLNVSVGVGSAGVTGVGLSLWHEKSAHRSAILNVMDNLITGCFMWFYVIDFMNPSYAKMKPAPIAHLCHTVVQMFN